MFELDASETCARTATIFTSKLSRDVLSIVGNRWRNMWRNGFMRRHIDVVRTCRVLAARTRADV